MKLTVFNGSPRAANSNTKLILENFLKGFCETKENAYTLFYLKNQDELANQCDQFLHAENVIIAFPLYLDSMPALVKNFFESIGSDQNITGKSIGYIIQSGFPEPNHFKYLEMYLNKLTRRLNCNYLGTITKGSGEAIRIQNTIKKPIHKLILFMGRFMNIAGARYLINNKRTFQLFYKLGQQFGITGKFDQKIKRMLLKPIRLSKFDFIFFKLLGEKMYFDILLKNNNSFKNRFDRSYTTSPF